MNPQLHNNRSKSFFVVVVEKQRVAPYVMIAQSIGIGNINEPGAIVL